ncbi:hypothetical protein PMAYCL1PPCAC_05699, partial [Pristionchus mayeri]
MGLIPVLLCLLAFGTLSSAIQCYNGTEVVLPGGSSHPQSTEKVQVPCSVDYCAWSKDSWLGVTVTGRTCGDVDICAEVNECKYGTLSIPNRTTGKTLYVKTTTCCCNGDLCNDLMPDVKPRRLTREEDEKLEEELKKKIQE